MLVPPTFFRHYATFLKIFDFTKRPPSIVLFFVSSWGKSGFRVLSSIKGISELFIKTSWHIFKTLDVPVVVYFNARKVNTPTMASSFGRSPLTFTCEAKLSWSATEMMAKSSKGQFYN